MNSPRFHFNRNFSENPLKIGDINLYQIGRRFCSDEEIIPSHAHGKIYELTIVTGGEGEVISNNIVYRVKQGVSHLSTPFDIHKIRAIKNTKLEYDFFSFTCDDEVLDAELKQISNNLYATNSRVFTDPKINNLISNAISEFSQEKPYSKRLLENIFNQILIYLIRDFNNVKDQTNKYTENEILCYQIMNYIDTHIYSIQNLSDISPKFKYNYSYLSNLFKKTTGKTLSDYFQSRRLEMARVLLNEKKYKVQEIASMLNYSSAFSFSKAFKQKYNCSPKFYK